jgi:2-alkyl-3-oxoalkanoate reductase
MKIFITGAGGLIGQHLTKELLKEGHQITSYSRSSYSFLEDWGVHQVQGDIQDLEKLKEAIHGAEACFHLAAKVAMWGRWKDFYQTNVIGTKNILAACKEQKVSYLVYTSTPSVVFGNTSICGGDEKLPYPKKSYGLYARSKVIAEKDVLATNGQYLKTISLRPHLVFGPGDKNLIPSIVESAKQGKLKRVGNGQNQVDILYVENAAKAHILALKALIIGKGAGEAYFLGQGPVKLWDFIDEVLKLNSIKPLTKSVPYHLAYITGKAFESAYSVFRQFKKQPPMTRFVAMQLAKNHYFSHEKAKRDLEWTPNITIEDGLKKLFEHS